MKTLNHSHVLLLSLLIVAQLTLSGCDILSSSRTKPRSAEPQTGYTDQQLIALAYSDYKFPDDFYQEELRGGAIYYVNTVSVLPLHERKNIWIEFCAEDRDQAFAWSESSSANSAYYRELVSENETEKYYEFRRVYTERPNDVILSRAHKCSYIDRSAVDNFLHSDTLGVFAQRPITSVAVKELAEYIYFVNTYNIGNYKALKSVSEEDESSFSQVIYQVNVQYGDFGLCDNIALGKVTYTVDRITGVIVILREGLRGVRGECR